MKLINIVFSYNMQARHIKSMEQTASVVNAEGMEDRRIASNREHHLFFEEKKIILHTNHY